MAKPKGSIRDIRELRTGSLFTWLPDHPPTSSRIYWRLEPNYPLDLPHVIVNEHVLPGRSYLAPDTVYAVGPSMALHFPGSSMPVRFQGLVTIPGVLSPLSAAAEAIMAALANLENYRTQSGDFAFESEASFMLNTQLSADAYQAGLHELVSRQLVLRLEAPHINPHRRVTVGLTGAGVLEAIQRRLIV